MSTRRVLITGSGCATFNAAVVAMLMHHGREAEIITAERDPQIYPGSVDRFELANAPAECDWDDHDQGWEHHYHNLRASTAVFDRVQQRRKALIANNKKQFKGTPKGARKREKRFVTVRW